MTFLFKSQRPPASFMDQIYLGSDQLIFRKILVTIGEELSSGLLELVWSANRYSYYADFMILSSFFKA